MTFTRRRALLVVLGAGSLFGGCGSGAETTHSSTGPKMTARSSPANPAPVPVPHPVPTPAPTGTPADPAAVDVIRAWSSDLRRGDVRDAARYFAIPSLLANGPGANGGLAVTVIRNLAQADAATSSLPCGAKLLSADQRGRYVNALFRLTDRPGPGGGCSSGAGQTARTNFVIKAGRIVEWIRAPDDPGDNAGPPPSPRLPPSASRPSAPPAPSRVI